MKFINKKRYFNKYEYEYNMSMSKIIYKLEYDTACESINPEAKKFDKRIFNIFGLWECVINMNINA